MAYAKNQEAVERLTPQQYRVTQKRGTERPGTGEYNDHKGARVYVDVVSGEPLFASSGWYESDEAGLVRSCLNKQFTSAAHTPLTTEG